MDNELVIHTDGGSRGNPGPAACGYVVEKGGDTLIKGSKFLGIATNNFAEYSGVITALELLKESKSVLRDIDKITFILDSELVVRQLNGVYKVKDIGLQKLFLQVIKLIDDINTNVVFTNVLRGENKLADQLLNEELDRQSSKK